MEPTLDDYLETMVGVCRELRRVLKPSGVFFLNVADSYARKSLYLMPQRLGIALVRSHIIWHKKNCMPQSVTDRPTSAHETIWMLTKSERYYWDADAVREAHSDISLARVRYGRSDKHKWADGGPGNQKIATDFSHACHPNSNIRNVWSMPAGTFPGGHFAVFPTELVERCLKAGCPVGGHVLDPFGGAGTTGLVADRLKRNATLIDLNTDYVEMARNRIEGDAPLFANVEHAAATGPLSACAARYAGSSSSQRGRTRKHARQLAGKRPIGAAFRK